MTSASAKESCLAGGSCAYPIAATMLSTTSHPIISLARMCAPVFVLSNVPYVAVAA
jgi:hypothetical protein